MGSQDVVDEMLRHIGSVVARPSQAFNGMPACPFVAKALRDRKVEFIVTPFSIGDVDDPSSSIMSRIASLDDQGMTLVFVHPNKSGISVRDIHFMVGLLLERIGPMFASFDGHPEDDFEIRGVFPRREPYPNIQVMHSSLLASSMAKLRGSNYYKGWSKEDIDRL